MVDKVTGRHYVQLDSRAMRRAIAELYPPERDVLDYITSRTDERNICYPGIKDIAAGCDMREDDAIVIIERLAKGKWLGFVRKAQKDPLTRQQLPNIYQVNPDYCVLNPKSEHYEEAIEIAQTLFHTSHLADEENPDSKTTANSGVVSTVRKHHQEAPPEKHRQEAPTEAPPEEATPKKSPEGAAPKKRGRKPNGSNADGQQPNIDQPEPQSAAAQRKSDSGTAESGNWRVPPPPDGYVGSLSLPAGESLAWRVYDAVEAVHGKNETSIVACRRLVDNFPDGTAYALKALIKAQARSSYTIANAMAWITGLARDHDTKPQPQQRPPAADDGSSYITGPYADFIEH